MVRLADKIRQADDRTENTIQVDEWGVKIGIRSMTARQRSDMQERWAEAGEQSATTLYENIILHCVFDPETGEPEIKLGVAPRAKWECNYCNYFEHCGEGYTDGKRKNFK